MIVRPLSWAGVSVQLPSPLSSPADSVAPPGTPLIVYDRLLVSEPSLSVAAPLMLSAIAVSSGPLASETLTVGVSVTGVTVISTV